MADDDNLMGELIAESKEQLAAIEPDLMALEEDLEHLNPDVINRIFRAVHSIKGGFSFFSMAHIKDLAHAMENVMGLIREGRLCVQPEVVDVLLCCVDKLQVLIGDIHHSEEIDIDEELAALAAILELNCTGPVVEEDVQATSTEAQSVYNEISTILGTPGYERLPEDLTTTLGNCLQALSSNIKDEGLETLNDLVADYTACVQTVGLDGMIRQVLADKLGKLRPFLCDQLHTELQMLSEEQEVSVFVESEVERPVEPSPTQPAGGQQTSKSLRVRVDLLDELMNLAGELVLSRNRIKSTLADKLATRMTTSPLLKGLQKQLASSRTRLEATTQAAGSSCAQVVAHEFDAIEHALHMFLNATLAEIPGLGGAAQDIDNVTSDLQSGIMSTRMQLVGSIFAKFPRVIRDIKRKLGKDMELTITDENVELDKSIIEALGAPLTHLIRNSADHGIEAPEVRKAAGKPAKGRIELIARHEGGQVFIEIIDDGAGIDPEIIRQKAVERGILTKADAALLSDREAQNMIFTPGFSTAQEVSDVSGRGVGMDVVRSSIEQIGGNIDIESTVGQGSRITLRLPLTLAIMPALVIGHSGRMFAVPQVNIEELVRIRVADGHKRIEWVRGKPVMRLRELVLPLVTLDEILGLNDDRAFSLTADTTSRSAFDVLVLSVGSGRYGLVVEKLIDSEEIVAKPLPERLKQCQIYAGTTIMGDGQIAMILDAAGVAASANLRFGAELGQRAATVEEEQVDADTETVLLFRNGTDQQFSVSLSMVKRIERVSAKDIEHVGNKKFLKYANSSLRLLELHDFLPIEAPATNHETCYVIVPKFIKHTMGILVDTLDDVLTTSATMDRETMVGPGILGLFTVDGNLIINLDVYGLFEAAEPDVFEISDDDCVRGKRVLLAEDTAFFRTIESDYLQQIGCQVDVAVDGEEAWTKLSDGEFDMLVTDIQMPRLDGIGLTSRVRTSAKYKNMPIVALTSLNSDADRKRILNAGVDAYEAKLDKESLRKTLEALSK